MKKLIVSVMGVVMLAGWPLAAADRAMDNTYCTKHCNTVQLSKEVKALEKEIAADKAAVKTGAGSEKLATAMAKKEQVKKHLDEHIRELSDLKVELDKAEADLNQMQSK